MLGINLVFDDNNITECFPFLMLQGVTVMTNKTFGVSIDELLRRSEGCEVPPIITSIVEYLATHGWC